MTPERWRQIEELFHSANERSPEDRSVFLDERCADDADLRKEVERLLASHDRAGQFIEMPAIETTASELAEVRADSMRGKVVGRYRILELIGTGGMGEVYLVEDTSLDRKAALKVLLPAYAGKDQDSLRRFQQEARAVSALSHPNIAHIYEIGQDNGTNFIAMEFVEGQLLTDHIRGLPLDSLEIVDICIQVADALDEAHNKGITHRDIKSSNIMITPRGRAKVLDFGLAKSAGSDDQTESDKSAGQVETRPGLVLGTISYMSPEQALGRSVDTRTDIFSLGVVLYEMTTGRLPFVGQSVTETIDKIAHAHPDAIARFNYEVPDELERIVKKALRKSRDERYQTAKDLLVDLRSLKRELEFAAQPENASSIASESDRLFLRTDGSRTGDRTARNTGADQTRTTSSAEYIVSEIKRHKWGSAITAAILIVAGLSVFEGLRKFVWSPKALKNASGSLNTMKTRRLITSATSGKAGNTSISPDGKFVVYKDDETDGRQGLWIRQVATGAARQIVPSEAVQYRGTTFSRDGNLVYYTVVGAEYSSGALFQVPVIGGHAKQLLVNISGPISQSPDGTQIAFVYQQTLMVANSDGKGARPLASRQGLGFFGFHGPSWSPDGKIIACGGVETAGGPYATVFGVKVENGETTQLTTHRWGAVRRVLWLGDGSALVVLAYDAEQEFSQLWELSYRSGEVRRITNDLNGHGQLSLGLTADSTMIVTQEEVNTSHIWIAVQDQSSSAKQITSSEGLNDGRFGLSWMPDGKLVYASMVNTAWDLWLVKPDGTDPRQLTFETDEGQATATTSDVALRPSSAGLGPRDQYPVVTPDGKTILFTSIREDGKPHVWRMAFDGSQPKQLTSGKDQEEHGARVSPDGRWVVYASLSGGQERLWKMPIEGGSPIQLTDYTSSFPEVSPDGRFIACTLFDEGAKPAHWRVAIVPFEGGQAIKVLKLPATADVSRAVSDGRAVAYVRWLNRGSAIAYVDRSKGVSNIWSQALDGSPARQLTNFTSGLIFNFEVSPDGKYIACARGSRTSDVILISDFR